MKYLDILRAKRAEEEKSRAEAVALLDTLATQAIDEKRDLSPEENGQIDWLRAVIYAFDDPEGEFKKLDERIGELEAVEARTKEIADRPEFQITRTEDPSVVLEDRSSTPTQLADALTRSLEGKVEDPENMAHVRRIAKRHAKDTTWARGLIARSTEAYTEGFAKLMTGREMFLTNEERAAVAVGTTTQGGFMVPTHLDPTIILTNDGTSNAIRPISRVVTLTEGNVWHGISSAGVTASFDAELSEVSDDSPTVASPSVTLFTARAFVQASIEAFEDINGLASDVLMMFSDARDRLEGNKHAVGTGTNEPWGIFAALDANTNVEMTSTTAATIGKVDLNAVYRAVPVRWRGRSKWLMNPLYSLAIHDLGTAVSASYSGDLREGPSGTILNKEVVESDDAPTAQTTTVRDNEIVFGDFSNFLIVDKPGSMSVEFIPTMFGTTNSLPIGARGWFAHWRTGSDSVNDLAFRLLQDKTSA